MKRWLLSAALVAALAAPALGQSVFAPPRLPAADFPHPLLLPIGPRLDHLSGTTTPQYDAEALRDAHYLGRAHLGWVGFDVVMQMQDEAGLERYAAAANDPHSLYYRHWLTPDQIGHFYGASQVDYLRTAEYFYNAGLGVRWWKQRETLRIVGPQRNVERALATHFGWFQKHGVTFFAPVTQPHFGIPLNVRGVSGIVNYHRMRRHMDIGQPFRAPQVWGPGFLVGYSPFDLAAAFDYTGAYNINPACCKGDGVNIAIVGTGPISTADVPFFKSVFNVRSIGQVTQVNVKVIMPCCYSPGVTTPPPVTAPCFGSLPACNPEDGEAQLDTEQTSSLAPNANVLFYLAYNPNECYPASGVCSQPPAPALGIGETDDELQQIADDNTADVVSGSYGIGELDFAVAGNALLDNTGHGADPAIFATMAAQGIAVFFSSGDSGAEGCQRDPSTSFTDDLCVSYPSADPNVTSVGGTTTPIGSNGRLTGFVTTWGVQTQTGGAGGGGFSTVFSRPAFEPSGSFCANKADTNGRQCDSTHRLQPDLSLNADPATGASITVNCGTGPSCGGLGGALIGSIGGTSESAPDMAAMWALVVESCKQTSGCGTGTAPHAYRLGNAAPLLYSKIYGMANYATTFYDVNYGNNAVPLTTGTGYNQLDPGFIAGTGYDLATGLGAPFARNLINAITGM